MRQPSERSAELIVRQNQSLLYIVIYLLTSFPVSRPLRKREKLLTQVLDANRDAKPDFKIVGLPLHAAQVLRLMCTDLVIPENVADQASGELPCWFQHHCDGCICAPAWEAWAPGIASSPMFCGNVVPSAMYQEKLVTIRPTARQNTACGDNYCWTFFGGHQTVIISERMHEMCGANLQ